MKCRYSVERTASLLRQKKAGASVVRLCCENDISVATFYTWYKKFRNEEGRTLLQISPEDERAVEHLTKVHDRHQCSKVAETAESTTDCEKPGSSLK